MSKFVNLTPHEVNVYAENTEEPLFSVPPEGTFLRAVEVRNKIGNIDGVPLNQVSFGEVRDLPEPQEDTYFIVSQITAQAIKQLYAYRGDFVITDNAVRDGNGKIIGCRAFAKV